MDAASIQSDVGSGKERITLSIEGLKLRRAEPDDASGIYEMFASPKVYPGTLQIPYPSKENWRKRLSENAENIHTLVAIIDDRIVGMVSVATFPHKPRRRHAGEIAICIHEEWQGKGMGKILMRAIIDLADNWLNLTRLELEVYADNKPAIHLYERFGFEVEGTMRQHAFRDGQYVDSKVMGRLRPKK
ncbi:MAG TPA: GNAT family N-acetyltransferase [Pyrinomonadaceae bacterium]